MHLFYLFVRWHVCLYFAFVLNECGSVTDCPCDSMYVYECMSCVYMKDVNCQMSKVLWFVNILPPFERSSKDRAQNNISNNKIFLLLLKH